MTTLRLTAVCLAVFGGLASPAAWACAGGGYPTGESCTTNEITHQGCCDGESTLKWCEDGQVCVKNCATNPANSCCQVSVKPGCCDAGVMTQVCQIGGMFECCTEYWGPKCIAFAMLYIEPSLDCPAGAATACTSSVTKCGWDDYKLFYNCAASTSADPSGGYARECKACTPQCDGKACGPDGCDGQCGACPSGATCNAIGQCIGQPTCQLQCDGKACGPDGCGGQCGTCNSGATCNAIGQCIAGGTCTPACDGKACGFDGCSGQCGVCSAPSTCNAIGQCIPPAVCVPNCEQRECGDDGCGGSCGTCEDGVVCASGVCPAPACTPACTGKVCGPDGCGGVCGACAKTATCNSLGECVPDSAIPIAACPPGEEPTYDGCVPVKTSAKLPVGCAAAMGARSSPTWFWLALISLSVRRFRARSASR